MKTILIFTYLFLHRLSTFAQSISIEFSIELKNIENHICGNHKLSSIPYLNLNYTNNSSDSLYFFKITDKFYFTTVGTHCFNSKKEIRCLDDINTILKTNIKLSLVG